MIAMLKRPKKIKNEQPAEQNSPDTFRKIWWSFFPERYAKLTMSVFALFACLSGILGTLAWYSSKLNQQAVQIETVSKLNSKMGEILMRSEDALRQNSVASYMTKLNTDIEETHNLFNALEQGGIVNGVKIKPLYADILTTNTDWTYVRRTWQDYKSHAESNHNDTQKLQNLTGYARRVDSDLQNAFVSVNNAVVKRSLTAANNAKYLSIAGVILLLVSYAIFVVYFVRRFHHDDQHLQNVNLELSEVLDSLSEGLFLLHEDFHISMQQSKRLKALLPQLRENGQNFLDVAGEILNNHRKLSATKMFIEQLYNPRVVEKLIHGLNPLDKVEVPSPKDPRETRVIGFQFSRIMDGAKIVKVLVSVKDLTDSVRIEARLQREQEQNDLQIEMISKMLNADESIMRGFLHTSLKQLAQINQILKQPNNSEKDLTDKIRLISQEIHAFKGEASMLDMSAFRLAAEAFEDMIKELRQKRQINGKDFLPLVSELDSLIEKLAQAEELHRKITGRLNNPMPAPTAATATDLGTILGKFVVNMGYRHNKNVIMETGGLEHLHQESESFPAVKDIIIQILRNAVVHGIEPVRVRTLNNKPTEGHIKLNVLPSGGKVRITIEDDGKGIDLNMLRQKAVEMKLATPEEVNTWSDNQLFSLIFRPHFSTLPEGENNEDGGRGMGMDVVRTRIKAINGNIGIQTQMGEYTRFTIVVPYQ